MMKHDEAIVTPIASASRFSEGPPDQGELRARPGGSDGQTVPAPLPDSLSTPLSELVRACTRTRWPN